LTIAGIAGGACGGVAELQADALKTAPPITADIEAASMDRLDSEPGPGVQSQAPGSSMPVMLGPVDHGGQHFIDLADAAVERVTALENLCSARCDRDQFG
jgi:hypothetical protein